MRCKLNQKRHILFVCLFTFWTASHAKLPSSAEESRIELLNSMVRIEGLGSIEQNYLSNLVHRIDSTNPSQRCPEQEKPLRLAQNNKSHIWVTDSRGYTHRLLSDCNYLQTNLDHLTSKGLKILSFDSCK